MTTKVLTLVMIVLVSVGVAKATVDENPPYDLVVWNNQVAIMYYVTPNFRSCRSSRDQLLATITYAELPYHVTCTPVGVLRKS